ncbi:MAG: TonB-dependent receptor [Rhodothermales bacterium]|nr:TonB-dependent receptor [Rhodothermales bacterium]MBO6780867.1 TonB-dependent receptor [Rhodothermales bacterium]
MFRILLLALILVPATAAAQSVSGTVETTDGERLARAEVVLLDAATGLQRYGTVTDNDGQFSLVIRAGTYTVRATHLGFTAAEIPLDVSGDETIALIVRNATLTAPEVVVTGNRARPQLTPVTASNLERAELDRRPEMKDLPVHLSSLPSITWYSENGNGVGYSYLRMRGFGQRRVAVSINGIPQNDPEEFNVFWINFFDIQGVIDDIQVQRGAGSSFYGPAAIGGAINIRAMPYKPYPYARVEAGLGAFGTRRMSISGNTGLLGDRYVAYGRLSRLESDGYRDWSWTEFTRFFAGITRYGDRSTLTLQAYGGPQRDGLAYVGIPKAANDEAVDDGFGGTIDRRYNFSALNDEVEDFHQPHVELHHNLEVRDAVEFDQSLFWIKGEGYFDFDGTFRSLNYLRLPEVLVPEGTEDLPLFVSRPGATILFRAYLDQWQVGWQPSLTFEHGQGMTRLGGEARLHRSLRWGRTQESDLPIPALIGDEGQRVYSFRGEKAIRSLYATHLARPSDRLAVQADVQVTHRRYRIHDEAYFGTEFSKSYVFVNPRIGVTLNPEQARSAYVSVALANREPRMKTLYDGEEAGAGFEPQFAVNADGSINTDEPFVSPERLIDLELGGTLRGERGYVNGNLFVMAFRDEIVPSGELDQFGVPRTGNAPKTRHAGIEVDGGVRVARGLDLSGNITLSRNRFIEFTEFDFEGNVLDRSGNTIAGFPDAMANLALSYTRGGLTASLFGTFVGQQYVDNSNGTLPDGSTSDEHVVDAYRLLNLSLRYDFGGALEGLELVADVNNVLDKKVLMFGNAGFGAPQFFPAATRHGYVGVRYTVR